MAPRAGAPDRVALFHGWADSPVWYRTSRDFGPVDLAALPISKELRDRLVAWNDFAGATLSANDYGWPDKDIESQHTATGSKLAEDLRRELSIEVIYTPDGDVDAPGPRLEPLADHVWIADPPSSGETLRSDQPP